jgi:hypothetical protein
MMEEFKKHGAISYWAFTETNEIIHYQKKEEIYRNDLKLIVKKELDTIGGLSSKTYRHKNTIIDSKTLKSVRSNRFIWGGLKCKLADNEVWASYPKGATHNTEVLELEVVDRLNRKSTLRYSAKLESSHFALMMNDLDTINRLGTFQGYIELKKAKSKIETLQDKITDLQAKQKKGDV